LTVTSVTVTQHKRTELCRVSVNIFLRFTLCLVLIDRLIKPVYMYTYDNYDLFVDWWAAQTWQYPQYVCLMTRPTCVRWLTAVRLRLLSESKSCVRSSTAVRLRLLSESKSSGVSNSTFLLTCNAVASGQTEQTEWQRFKTQGTSPLFRGGGQE